MTDLRLDAITRPDLGMLTHVSAELLATAVGGEELAKHMAELNLSCYQDADQRFWFGWDAPDFPDHDRWIATVSMADFKKAARSWDGIGYENVMTCGTLVTHGATAARGLMEAFIDLRQDLKQALDGLYGPADVQDRSRQAKRFESYQAFNTFYYDGLDAEVLRLPWDQDMHDLLRHYDSWLAYHPEAQDVPRDIVLRMHGLGTYVEARERGEDWLDARVQLEIS